MEIKYFYYFNKNINNYNAEEKYKSVIHIRRKQNIRHNTISCELTLSQI